MEEQNRNKAAVILYFICAAIWFVCVILDIVEKDFSVKFILHLVAAVLFTINGFVFMKKKLPSEKEDNSDNK